MNKWLKYTLLALLWATVAAYVIYAGGESRRRRAERKVSRVEVNVVDSTSQGSMVSGPVVREWLRRKGIPTIGTRVDEVQLSAIEELIAANGFVSRAMAYASYDGVLHIDISHREPLLRLMTDGMNAYVTDKGYVFTAPQASSRYVPVVTGSYHPPFPAGYNGWAKESVDREIARVEERIVKLDTVDRRKCYLREREYRKEYNTVRRERISKRWWRFESETEFDKRVEALLKKKAENRKLYRYRQRLIADERARIDERQTAERRTQKKLEKSYQDFMKLLTFVELVENDSFWRSEIVQIVARTASSGALELVLIPRSGRHTILFGRIENEEAKLARLMTFYRKGLSGMGWDEYRIIDIRYKDRVVCRR